MSVSGFHLFQQQRLLSPLCQMVGSPAPVDAGPEDDGVKVQEGTGRLDRGEHGAKRAGNGRLKMKLRTAQCTRKYGSSEDCALLKVIP